LSRYRWIGRGADALHDVGNLPDGTLHNPHGYPGDTVRAAVLAADQRRHERRSRATKKAGATRLTRRERQIYAIVQRLQAKQNVGPRSRWACCNKELGDPQSIQRSIGSDCWQLILKQITQVQQVREADDLELIEREERRP
jgi:hypothetical protein